MNNRSRSSLFLMEQLIVIMVFSICAAACVKIFVVSYLTVSDSKELTHALLVAGSAAECFKAAAGDPEKAGALLGAHVSDGTDTTSVYYDAGWQICMPDEAAYVMRILSGAETADYPSPTVGDISVEKITGEEIFSLTVAAGWDRNE